MKASKYILGAMAFVALVAAVAIFMSRKAADETEAETKRRTALIVEAKPAVVPQQEDAEENPEPPESEQDLVFDVGGKKFRSLQAAVDAAKDGDTITLTGDAYVRNPVAVRKSINFNLNGFHLVAKNSKLAGGRASRRGRFGAGAHAITVFGDKQVTVENGFIDIESNGGSGGYTGAVETVPEPAEEVAQEPPNDDWKFNTVLRDLEVTTDASRDAAFRNAEGKMLIDNCTVSSTGGNGSYTIGAGSETTIRDCSFNTTGTDGELSYWNNTIAVAYDGKATVESGSYVSQMAEGVEGTTYGTFVYSSGGTIEVNGGEFVADNVVQVTKDMATYGEEYGASEVVVNDGALSGKMESHTMQAEVSAAVEGVANAGLAEVVESAGVSAYGGVYDNAPSVEQVPEGKVVVDYGDGTYSVESVTRK